MPHIQKRPAGSGKPVRGAGMQSWTDCTVYNPATRPPQAGLTLRNIVDEAGRFQGLELVR